MPILQHTLTLDEDGSTFEAAVDGTTPKVFKATVPAGTVWRVKTIEVFIVDNAIQVNRFLGEAALTNGCLLKAHNADDSVLQDFLVNHLTGGAIKLTEDFVRGFATEYTYLSTQGGGTDDFLLVHAHTSEQAPGGEITLTAGQSIRFTVQDNLTGVTSLRMRITMNTQKATG